MPRTHHILGPASNLLGISLLVIAGLHISNTAARTIADEIAWVAAIGFSSSCIVSYLAIRRDDEGERRLEGIADATFMAGLLSLFVAIVVLALSNV